VEDRCQEFKKLGGELVTAIMSVYKQAMHWPRSERTMS